jgi:hypothetical protein
MQESNEQWKEPRSFLGQTIDVIYTKTAPVHESNAFTPGATARSG